VIRADKGGAEQGDALGGIAALEQFLANFGGLHPDGIGA
jgi:hypothetical protein